MTSLRNICGFAGVALYAATLAGCANATATPVSDEVFESDSIEQPIIGGQQATGDKYRAVGALVHGLEYPGYGFIPVGRFCTGTLVGPSQVLTARHCTPAIANPPYAEYGVRAYFNVGDNAYAPDEYVPISDFVAAPPAPSPAQGLLQDGGRDIAVAYLEAPITSAIPAKIGVFERSMLDTRFEIAGYGENGEFEGPRYAGMSTARALEGHWYSLLFNHDYQAYLAWYFDDAVTGNPTQYNANIWWSVYKLEPTYELYVGGGEDDAVGCYGDSGGPLLRGDTAEELTTYGVGFAGEPSKSQICALGSAFVPFYNNDIKDFVATATGL